MGPARLGEGTKLSDLSVELNRKYIGEGGPPGENNDFLSNPQIILSCLFSKYSQRPVQLQMSVSQASGSRNLYCWQQAPTVSHCCTHEFRDNTCTNFRSTVRLFGQTMEVLLEELS